MVKNLAGIAAAGCVLFGSMLLEGCTQHMSYEITRSNEVRKVAKQPTIITGYVGKKEVGEIVIGMPLALVPYNYHDKKPKFPMPQRKPEVQYEKPIINIPERKPINLMIPLTKKEFCPTLKELNIIENTFIATKNLKISCIRKRIPRYKKGYTQFSQEKFAGFFRRYNPLGPFVGETMQEGKKYRLLRFYLEDIYNVN